MKCLFTTCFTQKIFKNVKVVTILLIAGLIAGTISCSREISQQKTLKERFQLELESMHDRYGFPGVTAAYILPDGTTAVVAVGMADVEHGIPMKPDSRMLAASIGKTFVGATVLALENEEVLCLDDPISTWLGNRNWFSRLPNHNDITVRYLLNHTTGIANHVQSENFIQAFHENRGITELPLTPENMIECVLDKQPLFPAGASFHYSDTGYLIAGLIIEEVTGNTYYEEVERRFIEPLALTLTSPSNKIELDGLASGYLPSDNPFDLPTKTTVDPGVMCWNPAVEWTGGGLISNPLDLVIWAKALYEGTAIPGDYLQRLLNTVPVGDDSTGTRYGISVAVHNDGSHGVSYGHNGWIPGYCSSLRYYPDHCIAVAFQINTDIGIADGSTHLFEDMQRRLADVVISAYGVNH